MKIKVNAADGKTLYRLKNSSKFMEECEKIRRKLATSQPEVIENEKTGEIHIKNFNLLNNLEINEPYRLVNEFGLTANWATSIRNFLFYNKPLEVPSKHFHFVFNTRLSRWEQFIKVPTKDASVVIHESDIYMLRLYRKGRTSKQIASALAFFDRNMTEESVRKRLSIVRKQLGINKRGEKNPEKLSTDR